MTVRDLQHVVRPAPPLAPDDTIARAIRLMQARSLPVLPVADGDRLIGLLHETDLFHLTATTSEPRAAVHTLRVSKYMRPIELIAAQHQALDALAQALLHNGGSALPVTTSGGRYLGLLFRRDILAAVVGEVPPPPIAGLATLFGVHLTTGALRAGVKDLALASTGATLMILNLLAGGIILGLAKLADHLMAPGPVPGPPEPPAGVLFMLTVAFYGIQMAIFLLLLRFSPLTRVHGAEHMVVHAIEEGEDLTSEKVTGMSRVHARCGTNLMALLILLVIAQQFLSSLGSRLDEVTRALTLLVLVIVVLVTWRRLGAGLQRWVTTRQPSARQLTAAIGVGEDLLNKIRANPASRASFPRRVWNSGFLQVLFGFFLVAALAEYSPPLLRVAWAWLTG
jgi:CBS domain-containing protein